MYAQKDYPQRLGESPYSIAQKGSLVVADCNLLERFNKVVDPVSFNKLLTRRGIYLEDSDGYTDELGYHSLTAYDGTIYCSQVAGPGAWPDSPNTIVAFADKTYHLVADPVAQTIVDSWDGQIKDSGIFGPIQGWATYDLVIPEYTSINPLATTPNLTAKMRADQPDINIHYEVLETPRQMYIIKEGGANKWAFGNIEKIENLVPNGKTAQFENVTIVGIAKVDLGEDQAGFYMDALAFGDYATTHNVTNTIGYAWADLGEGVYIPPEVVVPPPPAPAEPVPDLPPPMPANPANPNGYKTTYRAFEEPEWYRIKRDVTVQEFDGRGSDRHLKTEKMLEITGMFMVAGQWYGLPLGSQQIGKWYGIADDAMLPVDNFIPTALTPIEKLAEHRKLSLDERVEIVKAKSSAQLERFKGYKERYFKKEN